MLYCQGVDSQNLERSRKRALKRLLLDDIGAGHLFILVPDPEKLAKDAELAGLAGMQLLGEAEHAEYAEMQDDFLPFSDSDPSSKESDDSVTFFLGN
jgi:hypothetical protein